MRVTCLQKSRDTERKIVQLCRFCLVSGGLVCHSLPRPIINYSSKLWIFKITLTYMYLVFSMQFVLRCLNWQRFTVNINDCKMIAQHETRNNYCLMCPEIKYIGVIMSYKFLLSLPLKNLVFIHRNLTLPDKLRTTLTNAKESGPMGDEPPTDSEARKSIYKSMFDFLSVSSYLFCIFFLFLIVTDIYCICTIFIWNSLFHFFCFSENEALDMDRPYCIQRMFFAPSENYTLMA